MAFSPQVQMKPSIDWSDVENSAITLEKLHLLTSSQQVLLKDGYIFKSPDGSDLWRKMRCQNCGQKITRYRPPPSDSQPETAVRVSEVASSMFTPRQHCFFHDGQTFKGEWQCCGGRANTKGCCSNIDHVAGPFHELETAWLFYKTPNPTSVLPNPAADQATAVQSFIHGGTQRGQGRGRYTNTRSSRTQARLVQKPQSIRAVVALDCEMGISRLGSTILIRLSLIDFFTQESLIESLVSPTVEMAHYNTRYSGVTFAAMRNAVRTNTAIKGTDAARSEVFRYVDSNTIVIVHGGSNDFTTLRWIHPASRIIDTCVLETYDHMVKENHWKRGLKDVCRRRCGISVQDAKLDNGRAAGHDSLEDALAAREIVCWWLRLIPDQ